MLQLLPLQWIIRNVIMQVCIVHFLELLPRQYPAWTVVACLYMLTLPIGINQWQYCHPIITWIRLSCKKFGIFQNPRLWTILHILVWLAHDRSNSGLLGIVKPYHCFHPPPHQKQTGYLIFWTWGNMHCWSPLLGIHMAFFWCCCCCACIDCCMMYTF